MHDADARRHHLERIEGLHAPFEELVTLTVALELQVQVLAQGIRRTVVIHLHRVVHDQVHRHQRLDQFGIPAQPRQRRPHRRQVHQQRHTGKVLQHDARHHKRDLFLPRRRRLPVCQCANVLFQDPLAVAVAQYRFQHQPDGHRQPGHRPYPAIFQAWQRIQLPLPAIPQVEASPRAKQILCFAHKIHLITI